MFVIDNNVLLDVIFKRKKYREKIKILNDLIAKKSGFIPAASLHQMDYIVRKNVPTKIKALYGLIQKFQIIKTPSYVDFECDLATADIEDYLIELSARAVGGRVITSDKMFLERSELAIHPDNYFDVVRKQQYVIPFCDLKTQYQQVRPQIEEKIDGVLTHGQYIMGPEVAELEKKLSGYTGAKHCITVASGTDALLMALMALGIGPGDEVITSPFTFVATGEVISLVGATPVFVDIDPQTFNIDSDKIAAAITNKTRVIIPVSLFGLPADMDAIVEVVTSHQLPLATHPITVIEDAAQSFGATYKSCNLSTLACTSFFPAKPLGCYGDGGAVFTDDDALANILRSIRIHGKGSDKYDNVRIGINGRLDTLQAAILLPKLDIFPAEIEARQKAADIYNSLLADFTHRPSPIATSHESNTHSPILTPFVPPGYSSAWAQYSVLTASKEQRDNLQKQLAKAGVPTAVYYPKPLHLQTAYAGLGYKTDDFPVAEDVAQRIVSLPMGPYIKEEDQVKVVRSILTSVDMQSLST